MHDKGLQEPVAPFFFLFSAVNSPGPAMRGRSAGKSVKDDSHGKRFDESSKYRHQRPYRLG